MIPSASQPSYSFEATPEELAPLEESQSSSAGSGTREPHEEEKTSLQPGDLLAVASTFDRQQSFGVHSPTQPGSHGVSERSSIHEDRRDWRGMSPEEVKRLPKEQLEQSLDQMHPDDFKEFQKKMDQNQQAYIRKLITTADEEAGLAAPEPPACGNQVQSPVGQMSAGQGAASSGSRKSQKRPPDYTEFNRLRQVPPPDGQGILGRARDLKTAKNMAEGNTFPRLKANLEVHTSPTLLRQAAKETKSYKVAKDLSKSVKESAKSFVDKVKGKSAVTATGETNEINS